MIAGDKADSRLHTSFREQTPMRILSALRAGLIALTALAGALFGPAAYADSGGISFSVIKAGFVIGGSAGSGTLSFHGRQYPLGIGGLSYGFTFGASETHFRGTVSNIQRPGGCLRRLCRGKRRRGAGAGRAGHRAHQPARRGADADRQFGRRHRQRGSQWPGHHGEVSGERVVRSQRDAIANGRLYFPIHNVKQRRTLLSSPQARQ